MPREIFFELIGNLFTFQSGYIQMTSSKLSRQFLITLHSNLVIFKLNSKSSEPVNVNCFTFQSGYIQIGSGIGGAVGGIPFTFQSGYIQMLAQSQGLYSGLSFTFQSGYIQIRF